MLENIVTIDSNCNESIDTLNNIISGLSTDNINYLSSIKNDYCLKLEAKTLSIVFVTKKFKPFVLDYSSSKYIDCIKNAKNSLLNKACKITPQSNILDMSCGWGRDSLTMSCLGANVTSLEINPLVAILVQYAKAKLAYTWQVLIADSIEYINTHKNFDIIYLDPMFPPKKSLSSKSLQILALLCNSKLSIDAMLEHTLAQTNTKTIIKLPLNYKTKQTPNYKIYGKAIKWYVFIPS